MVVDGEDEFLLQLARSIQAWLWIEADLYALYAMLMQGAKANAKLVHASERLFNVG